MILARTLGFIALLVGIFIAYIFFLTTEWIYFIFYGLSCLTAGYLMGVKG